MSLVQRGTDTHRLDIQMSRSQIFILSWHLCLYIITIDIHPALKVMLPGYCTELNIHGYGWNDFIHMIHDMIITANNLRMSCLEICRLH